MRPGWTHLSGLGGAPSVPPTTRRRPHQAPLLGRCDRRSDPYTALHWQVFYEPRCPVFVAAKCRESQSENQIFCARFCQFLIPESLYLNVSILDLPCLTFWVVSKPHKAAPQTKQLRPLQPGPCTPPTTCSLRPTSHWLETIPCPPDVPPPSLADRCGFPGPQPRFLPPTCCDVASQPPSRSRSHWGTMPWMEPGTPTLLVRRSVPSAPTHHPSS